MTRWYQTYFHVHKTPFMCLSLHDWRHKGPLGGSGIWTDLTWDLKCPFTGTQHKKRGSGRPNLELLFLCSRPQKTGKPTFRTLTKTSLFLRHHWFPFWTTCTCSGAHPTLTPGHMWCCVPMKADTEPAVFPENKHFSH